MIWIIDVKLEISCAIRCYLSIGNRRAAGRRAVNRRRRGGSRQIDSHNPILYGQAVAIFKVALKDKTHYFPLKNAIQAPKIVNTVVENPVITIIALTTLPCFSLLLSSFVNCTP